MAQKYLGDYFDIHCGGEDHIPVHHTNEIAQTEARVRHAARELLDARLLPAAPTTRRWRSRRASSCALKSLVERGYDPLAYRYLCLTAHYRSQLNFTWDALDAAATALERMRNGVYALRDAPAAAPDAALVERFTARGQRRPQPAARARGRLGGAARRPAAPAVRRATLLRFDAVFGLRLAAWAPRQEAIPPDDRARSPRRGSPRARRRTGPRPIACARRSRAGGWEMEDGPDGYALKRRG